MTPALSNVILALEEAPWYSLNLQCGHTVYTSIKLRQQYPEDKHVVFCKPCRDNKAKDLYGRPPSAWSNVIGVKAESDDDVRNVREWAAFILSRDVMRLQPSVPRNRIRPFPYVKGGA